MLRKKGGALPLAGSLAAAGLGVGYMLLQLGLHQRLSIVVGHPIIGLALLTATFILGSGIGSALMGGARVGPRVRASALLGSLALSWVLLLSAGVLQSLAVVPLWTTLALSLVLVGMGLGAQLPGLLQRFPNSVASLWTVNGAASVIGAALAALVGLVGGSPAVLVGGTLAYLLVFAVTVREGVARSPSVLAAVSSVTD